jgi:non-ribosomal peptide synthetase component F
MVSYDDTYRRWREDPEGFWHEPAAAVDRERTPRRVLDDSRAPLYHWFPDGVLNTCHNALDRHVDGGRAEQVALIYESPVTGQVRRFTYCALRDEVARCAGALRRLGVAKGDRVIIYMPMIPEAVVATLACARLGAVHSVVFGGFAANELASRIEDSRAKLVISASCGLEPNRIVETSRCWTAHWSSSPPRRSAASSSSARSAPRSSWPVATWSGTRRWKVPSRPSACRSPPRIPCTSSTPRAQPGCPRGSCETTAATPLR